MATAKTENGATEKKTEVSKLEKHIIGQLEYYFSDSNLYRDKFLQEQLTKDEGWVPVSTLLTFKRLAALSEDAKEVVDSIEKSDEGLIEISEDRLKLRRHPERPLPPQSEEVRKEIITRTAYVKGFPLDAQMADLIDFFNAYEKVVNIVMRKYHDKATKTYKFKGSVFATFATKEECAAFLEKEKIEFKDVALVRKWQADYNEEKREERSKKAAKAKKAGDDAAAASEKSDTPEIELPKNAVLHLDGLGEENSREQIKAAFLAVEEGLEIAFINYSKGEKEAFVRFSKADEGKRVLALLEEGKLKVEGAEVTVRLIEGDEEAEYLKKQATEMKTRRDAMRNNKKGGKRNRQQQQRGNRQTRKRKAEKNDDGGDEEEDEPPTKK